MTATSSSSGNAPSVTNQLKKDGRYWTGKYKLLVPVLSTPINAFTVPCLNTPKTLTRTGEGKTEENRVNLHRLGEM